MSRVVHFEIHADDLERAMKFYNAVFEWDFTKWESEESDPYWLIATGPKSEPGIDGGLSKRQGSTPKGDEPITSFVCMIDVAPLDEYLKKVQNAGGSIVVDKMAVKGVGWLAYAKDTEGNMFGMMEEDKTAS